MEEGGAGDAISVKQSAARDARKRESEAAKAPEGTSLSQGTRGMGNRMQGCLSQDLFVGFGMKVTTIA